MRRSEDVLCLRVSYQLRCLLWDHSFSTYAKFSGNGSFLGNFAYVPNGFRRLNNFFPQPLLSQKIKMQFFAI